MNNSFAFEYTLKPVYTVCKTKILRFIFFTHKTSEVRCIYSHNVINTHKSKDYRTSNNSKTVESIKDLYHKCAQYKIFKTKNTAKISFTPSKEEFLMYLMCHKKYRMKFDDSMEKFYI